MSQSKTNAAVAGSLLFAVFLWGGNNAGTKWLVMAWPPIWTGSIRFLLAGALLLALLRCTEWLGEYRRPPSELRRQLWLRGGLVLAIYIIAFNWALRLTSASHVALYLGASPVWALLWEERPRRTWASARRYGAALLAVSGVLVLLWPALRTAKLDLLGEFFGLASSILWATFSRQMRFLSVQLSGTEVAAHTMWMSGILLLPFGLVEIVTRGLPVNAPSLGVLAFCAVFGGVVPYALWNDALRRWRTSRVMLFNNLIPLSTMSWAHFFLGEPVTPTFWAAMILIVAGVIVGQNDWMKIAETPERHITGMLVVGYGNVLRCDDGVGPKVAEAVEELHLPDVRTLICQQLSPEHAEPISQARIVVFVDAAVDAPREVLLRKLEPSESSQLMAHAADPRTMLALARDVFGHAPVAWWLTIPAAKLDFGHDLSPDARLGFERAVQEIKNLCRLAN